MTSAVQTQVQQPEVKTEAVFERLPVDPFIACDGHANQGIQAIVTMLTANGSILYLCGHHARKCGFEHTKDAPAENRSQGSANLCRSFLLSTSTRTPRTPSPARN
jgi:hypothetical protein